MSLHDEIAQQALMLPPDDRAFVADVLEQSLPRSEFATPEIAEAWSRELDRRLAADDRGESTALEFDTVLDHIQTALNPSPN